MREESQEEIVRYLIQVAKRTVSCPAENSVYAKHAVGSRLPFSLNDILYIGERCQFSKAIFAIVLVYADTTNGWSSAKPSSIGGEVICSNIITARRTIDRRGEINCSTKSLAWYKKNRSIKFGSVIFIN